MRGYDVEESDFVALLTAFPEGLGVVRGYLQGGFGIIVGVVPAHQIWYAIERERSEEGAADVVSELVISKGGPRVRELVALAAADEELYLRADDPELARLMFQEEDWNVPEVGTYVADYYRRTRPFMEANEPAGDPSPEASEANRMMEPVEEDIEEHAELDLSEFISGTPRSSAVGDASWSLQRVQTPRRGYLTVPRDWLEANLEQFLWSNWGKLDLGLDRPLYLVERQVSLNPATSDRVDLLARGTTGEWVAIELKIVRAGRGDLTQLLSYMADLERRGEAKSKVRGVLIAPSFVSKVENAAAADPRVTLLRFFIDEGPAVPA